MKYLSFTESGELHTVVPERFKKEGTIYYNAPEGFDPKSQTAILQDDIVKVMDIPTAVPLTEYELTKQSILKVYQKRAMDGINYFENKRAELVIDIRLGAKSKQEVFEIEAALRVVKGLIITGDWESALQELMLRVTPLDGFTKAYKEEVLAEIQDYVSKNFIA